MSRELSDHDWDILKKLAPELCEGGTCVSSGRKYRSILPPLSMHYSKSKEDFTQRLEKLTDEELDYLDMPGGERRGEPDLYHGRSIKRRSSRP